VTCYVLSIMRSYQQWFVGAIRVHLPRSNASHSVDASCRPEPALQRLFVNSPYCSNLWSPAAFAAVLIFSDSSSPLDFSVRSAAFSASLTFRCHVNRSIFDDTQGANHPVFMDVTSSVSCPIDRPWAHSYRLSIGTITLSGFVSEIFSPKDY